MSTAAVPLLKKRKYLFLVTAALPRWHRVPILKIYWLFIDYLLFIYWLFILTIYWLYIDYLLVYYLFWCWFSISLGCWFSGNQYWKTGNQYWFSTLLTRFSGNHYWFSGMQCCFSGEQCCFSGIHYWFSTSTALTFNTRQKNC